MAKWPASDILLVKGYEPIPMTHVCKDENVTTDEELLAEHVAGNRDAMAQIIRRYEKELYAFLQRFVGDHAVAEDLFQDTFIQVHRNAAGFDAQRRFRPWVFTIAANKARDYLRANGRRTTQSLNNFTGDDDNTTFLDLMQSGTAPPVVDLAREEDIAQVQVVLESLPAHYREVLLLSFYHQFAYKQMSEMLGIPLGTVKSRLHAAVASFAKEWERREKGKK